MDTGWPRRRELDPYGGLFRAQIGFAIVELRKRTLTGFTLRRNALWEVTAITVAASNPGAPNEPTKSLKKATDAKGCRGRLGEAV